MTMLEKEHDNSSSISGSSPSASKEILDSPSFSFEGRSVPVISGRPNLKSILSEWISTCGQSISVNGELFYDNYLTDCSYFRPVSGPTSLIADIRSTFCDPSITGLMTVLRGGPSIQLNVESFSI